MLALRDVIDQSIEARKVRSAECPPQRIAVLIVRLRQSALLTPHREPPSV